MSYHTWHNYGYGICTDDLKVDSVERIEALLAFAPKYRARIHEWLEDCEISEPTVDDYWEFDEYERLGIGGQVLSRPVPLFERIYRIFPSRVDYQSDISLFCGISFT